MILTVIDLKMSLFVYVEWNVDGKTKQGFLSITDRWHGNWVVTRVKKYWYDHDANMSLYSSNILDEAKTARRIVAILNIVKKEMDGTASGTVCECIMEIANVILEYFQNRDEEL